MPKANQAERLLWAMGITCAGYLLLLAAQAQVSHHRATYLAESAVGSVPASGSVIGRVEIPRLHLSVAVLEDDQAKSLLRGLGHLRGTAQLGGLGTVALAGHRDTFLRPLRNVTPGMQILASTQAGVFLYIVDSTEIVLPESVDVLDIRSRPELILITCYPFNFVGAAPKRFVVHAHLVSVAPETLSHSASSAGN